MVTPILGLDCKLYRNTGTLGTPTWELIENVRDVNLAGEKATADVTIRGGSGWRQKVGTLKDGELTFEMIYDNADTDYAAIRDAWDNNTTIDLAMADGDIAVSGTQYFRGSFHVSMNINQPLEGAVTADVTCEPSTEQTPSMYVVP